MKIISKFKDFYDYLQGIYGVDNKLVLDRTISPPILYKPSFDVIMEFHIGEWMVQCLYKDGKFLYGGEIEPFAIPFKSKIPFHKNPYDLSLDNFFFINNGYDDLVLKYPVQLDNKSPTIKYNFPILIEDQYGRNYLRNPILKEFEIQKVFSAHDIWLILSEWLSKRITEAEPKVPVGDDKTRIVSAGFDLKTSFRKTK